MAGAIRSFLQKSRVQYPDDVRVCIRTDVRPQHSRFELDNKFSMAFIKLPVGTEGTVPMLCSLEQIVFTMGFIYFNQGELTKILRAFSQNEG